MNQLLDYFNQDELASSVWKGKYALKGEETPDNMHRRMAKEFARIELKYAKSDFLTFGDKNFNINSLSEYGRSRADTLSEELIYQMFKDFKYICPQGSVMSQLGNNESIGSLSNCVVIGQPEDSYGGIFQKDEEMAQLEKRRCGVGLDISTLRPSGSSTTNAAKSSTGAVSFMERYSNTTREVAQNGRRGALMLSMDIRHPDVMDFIKSKEDLSKITGANISVMVRDDFMEAVKNDEDYILRFPCDREFNEMFNTQLTKGGITITTTFEPTWLKHDMKYNITYDYGENKVKRVKAKEYWEALTTAAHKSAEPGIIFVDQHWNYSPDSVYSQYKGITTNPCGEIFMPAFDTCRLIALNLFSFVTNPFTKDADLDYDLLYKMAYEQQRLADDLIDLEIEKIDKILIKLANDPEGPSTKRREIALWTNIKKVAQSGRRTGCGFTGLGDMIAALGHKYDSSIALQVIKDVMECKMRAELDCTIDLAILRGTFEGFDSELEFPTLESGTQEISNLYGNEFYRFLWSNFREQAGRMQEYGRRNVSWSTVAPTGSLSILTQTTSGLEPLFAPYYMRRKKVNPGDEGTRVDFTDDNGDTWMEYAVMHPKFKEWMIQTSCCDQFNMDKHITGEYTFSKDFIQQCFEQSPWYQATANDIDWTQRVKIQDVIQRYTSHSISSTINLPNDVSVDEVTEIYERAWELGLKGVTVYRDGCRSGVLVTDNSTVSEKFTYSDSPKRPKELDAEYYFATSKGKKYAVIVGLLDEKPYEVFAFEDPLNEEHLKGKIIKMKKGVYKFESVRYTIDNLQLSSEHSDEKLLTRFVSSLLRHGVHPKYVIEQTEKAELEITSFGKVLVRTLKRYIPDGEKSTVTCKNCNSDSIVYEEGCMTCKNCGDSKCG